MLCFWWVNTFDGNNHVIYWYMIMITLKPAPIWPPRFEINAILRTILKCEVIIIAVPLVGDGDLLPLVGSPNHEEDNIPPF